jgi:hypothetical protein
MQHDEVDIDADGPGLIRSFLLLPDYADTRGQQRARDDWHSQHA